MNAFRAVKSDFITPTQPLRVRSRDSAISAMLEDEEQVALHEQVVDPMVYRAANELIRLDDEGHKTDIEAQGPVFDVLQTIESELMDVGASRLTATQILDTLKTYVSGLGADFARQAKAKPLYARVIVTDKEPEDIPDCKLSSVTCIDGTRVQGDDAGKMSMTLTLYGTSNAMSRGMSMDRIFESGKKKWLMVYYGTIEGADLNKFDTVDADLATLIQAVGAGGAASVEDIRKAIEQGTLSPQVMQLINTVAELNRTIEAARTPGAVEKPEQKIAELKAAILEISQNIPDMQALPQSLLQAVMQTVESADAAFTISDVSAIETPSNDNDTVSVQMQAVLEQVQILLENDALPPEVKEKLIALVETVGEALPDKKFAQMETAIAGIKETLMDFAASDEAGPQIFRTISEILPSIVVAEKQIGEAALHPPVVEGQKQENAADALPPEIVQTIAALQTLTADKIDIILKDETVAPEIKEKLRDVIKAVEAAIDNKDIALLAVAATEMRQSLTDLTVSDVLPPQVARALVEALPVLVAVDQKFSEAAPVVTTEKPSADAGLIQEIKTEAKPADVVAAGAEAKAPDTAPANPVEVLIADGKAPEAKAPDANPEAGPKSAADGVIVESKGLEGSTPDTNIPPATPPTADGVTVEGKAPDVIEAPSTSELGPKPTDAAVTGADVKTPDTVPTISDTGETLTVEGKGPDVTTPVANPDTGPKTSADSVVVEGKGPEGIAPDTNAPPVTPPSSDGVKQEGKTPEIVGAPQTSDSGPKSTDTAAAGADVKVPDTVPTTSGTGETLAVEGKGPDVATPVANPDTGPKTSAADDIIVKSKGPDGSVPDGNVPPVTPPTGDGLKVESKTPEVVGAPPISEPGPTTPAEAVIGEGKKVEAKAPDGNPETAPKTSLENIQPEGKDNNPALQPDNQDTKVKPPVDAVIVEGKGAEVVAAPAEAKTPTEAVKAENKGPETKAEGKSAEVVATPAEAKTPTEAVKAENKGPETKAEGKGAADPTVIPAKSVVQSPVSEPKIQESNNPPKSVGQNPAPASAAPPEPPKDSNDKRGPKPSDNPPPQPAPVDPKEKIIKHFTNSGAGGGTGVGPANPPTTYTPPTSGPTAPPPNPQPTFIPTAVPGPVEMDYKVTNLEAFNDLKKRIDNPAFQNLGENISYKEFETVIQKLPPEQRQQAIDGFREYTAPVSNPPYQPGPTSNPVYHPDEPERDRFNPSDVGRQPEQPAKEDPVSEQDCPENCDRKRGCCPAFNGKAAKTVEQTAESVIGGFKNFENNANAAPARTYHPA